MAIVGVRPSRGVSRHVMWLVSLFPLLHRPVDPLLVPELAITEWLPIFCDKHMIWVIGQVPIALLSLLPLIAMKLLVTGRSALSHLHVSCARKYGRDGARLSPPVTALDKVLIRADEGLNVSNSVGQMEDRLGETQVSILCHLLRDAGLRGGAWMLACECGQGVSSQR